MSDRSGNVQSGAIETVLPKKSKFIFKDSSDDIVAVYRRVVGRIVENVRQIVWEWTRGYIQNIPSDI